LVLRDGLLEWGFTEPNRLASPETAARQLRDVMQAWRTGLAPLSNLSVVFPIDGQEELMKIAVAPAQGGYLINWHERPELPEVCAGPSRALNPLPGERNICWYTGIPDHPAWAWQVTQKNLRSGVMKILGEDSFLSGHPLLHRETAWVEGCELTDKSAISATTLSLSQLKQSAHYNFRHTTARFLMNTYIEYLRQRGEDYFEAPYPQSDQEPTNHSMALYFSHERAVQRATAIYQTALTAYRELAELFFPKMVKRFPYYATWPFDMIGIISLSRSGESFVLDWGLQPLPKGSLGRVRFWSDSEDNGQEFLRRQRQRMSMANDDRPSWHFRSCGSRLLNLWETTPATRIVQDLLKSDLKAVGWG
jgi:hypothetical protein